MKIVVLHGQSHHGSTWNITALLLAALCGDNDSILEFNTNDIPPCIGCFTCIVKDEELCPHRSTVEPIISAIENADIVIAESPNYCMGMTGQMKILFDHMGYRWLSHRPHPFMKHKIGITVSTTSGMGAGGVTKDIAKHMFWWGIPKTYRLPFTVAASSWAEVKEDKKKAINAKIEKVARQVKRKLDKVKPGIKLKFIFGMMRSMQKGSSWNPIDRKHWEDNCWIPTK